MGEVCGPDGLLFVPWTITANGQPFTQKGDLELGAELVAAANRAEKLETALGAEGDLQWSTGAWGNTREEDLAAARPILQQAIARAGEALAETETQP